MIHDIDILQAVQQKLKERFPYPVYLQEVKEGFRPPAFFLKTMTVASPQGRKEVYRDTDMYITYIPQKQTASASIYEVLAAAEDLFRDGIAVQDRFFAVRSMNEELIGADNGGRLTLTVQYYDSADETEAVERMKVLHQRYRERRQRNMKMPSINVVFKEKGISAIERSERGIVLMILKEETLPSETEVNLYTADDIPKELSDSNREQLELALRAM